MLRFNLFLVSSSFKDNCNIKLNFKRENFNHQLSIKSTFVSNFSINWTFQDSLYSHLPHWASFRYCTYHCCQTQQWQLLNSFWILKIQLNSNLYFNLKCIFIFRTRNTCFLRLHLLYASTNSDHFLNNHKSMLQCYLSFFDFHSLFSSFRLINYIYYNYYKFKFFV